MKSYSEIKQRYSPVDSEVRADIHLLCNALERAAKEALFKRGIDFPYQCDADIASQIKEWMHGTEPKR